MSKKTTTWLIIATALVLIGCILFVSVMKMCKWDFTKLSTVKYETATYEFSENIYNITLETDTADIEFLPTESEKITIVCYQQPNIPHSVIVKDGVLTVTALDTRKWYEHIEINFNSPKITIYLPRNEYGALNIKCSTGDIELPRGFIFENVKVKTNTGKINALDIYCKKTFDTEVSTGKTKISNLNCENFISRGDTGDIALANVIATLEMNITRNTGNVKFENCDANNIYIETDTGDISGSLLGGKIFTATSNTGKIKIPQSASGGFCEIKTDTGDITINIKS